MPADSSRLRNTIIAIAVPVAVGAVGIGTFLADRVISSELEGAAFEKLRAVSRRASTVISQYLDDNRGDLLTLSRGPAVVSAARDAGERSDRSGLSRLDLEELETRFAETRVLRTDPVLVRYLESFQQESDLVEIFFTERNGFNVATTNVTSDFVQSDEDWWQQAFAVGTSIGAPEFDESAGMVALEVSVRIDDPATEQALGVLKGVIRLTRLAHLVAGADEGGGAVIEVVDSAGRVLLARDTTRMLRRSVVADLVTRAATSTVERADVPGEGSHLISVAPTNEGRWNVVTRLRTAEAFRVASAIRRIVLVSGGTLVLAMVTLVWMFTTWLNRRVTRPVQAAASVTAKVADGDLSVSLGQEEAGAGEVQDLLQSVQGMVGELRKLVSSIRGSSEELSAMAEEISASTEQMSASTQEMAGTSQRLSSQSTEQADQVRKAAGDAKQILSITTHLADGARLASERSTQLQQTADQHRSRLLAGSDQLSELAGEVGRGAEEAQALAAHSTEVQRFVTQAKAIANQTNMLALNAAIEAARAGGEGRGFGVVADEVRKLASQAAQAAATTSETVGSVLEGVDQTTARLRRLADESVAVRSIAESAAQGLQEVTDQAAESSAWAEEISGAAGEARRLVDEITQRLTSISEATESFVAAVEQIAASAEQQSASTQEIASSAAQLARASDTLNSGVSRFHLYDGPGSDNGS